MISVASESKFCLYAGLWTNSKRLINVLMALMQLLLTNIIKIYQKQTNIKMFKITSYQDDNLTNLIMTCNFFALKIVVHVNLRQG